MRIPRTRTAIQSFFLGLCTAAVLFAVLAHASGLLPEARAAEEQRAPLDGFVRVEQDGHVRFLNLRHVVTYRPTVVDDREIVVYELVDGRSIVSEVVPGR